MRGPAAFGRPDLHHRTGRDDLWKPTAHKVMNFFGRRVPLDRGVELLHRRTGAPVLLGLMERVGGAALPARLRAAAGAPRRPDAAWARTRSCSSGWSTTSTTPPITGTSGRSSTTWNSSRRHEGLPRRGFPGPAAAAPHRPPRSGGAPGEPEPDRPALRRPGERRVGRRRSPGLRDRRERRDLVRAPGGGAPAVARRRRRRGPRPCSAVGDEAPLPLAGEPDLLLRRRARPVRPRRQGCSTDRRRRGSAGGGGSRSGTRWSSRCWNPTRRPHSSPACAASACAISRSRPREIGGRKPSPRPARRWGTT